MYDNNYDNDDNDDNDNDNNDNNSINKVNDLRKTLSLFIYFIKNNLEQCLLKLPLMSFSIMLNFDRSDNSNRLL